MTTKSRWSFCTLLFSAHSAGNFFSVISFKLCFVFCSFSFWRAVHWALHCMHFSMKDRLWQPLRQKWNKTNIVTLLSCWAHTHTQFVSILSSFGTESKSIHFTLYDWPVVNLLNTRNVEVSTLPFLNSQIDTNDSFLSHRNSANDVIGNCVLFPVHAIT